MRTAAPLRSAIIERSTNHTFTKDDFSAIKASLYDLGSRGNKKAWQYVEELYPGGWINLRLTGTLSVSKTDAINDLGTDDPDQATSVMTFYTRDPKVRSAVMNRAKGRCEFCGSVGFLKADGTRYLESHHIIALANDGADRITNVVALCPNDHREAHSGQRSDEIEKQKIKKVNAIVSKRMSTR